MGVTVTARTVAEIPKANDVTIRVRDVTIGDITALELRDWIVSVDEPGRGFRLPRSARALRDLAAALSEQATIEETAGRL